MDITAITETKGKLFVASVALDSSETQIGPEVEGLSMDDSIRGTESASIIADEDFVTDQFPPSQHQVPPGDMRMDVCPEPINENSPAPINQPSLFKHLSPSDRAEIIGCMSSFWSDVQDDPFVCLQRPIPLSLLCPRCFGDDPKPEIGFVSVDGNFQHRRFPTSKIDDDTYLEDQDRRLFISTNHTEVTPVNFELAKYVKMPSDDSDSAIKQTPCGRHFKAAAEKDVSNQVVDTGMMAIVCRCGVPLRLHNVRGTGERAIYALRLLESVLSDESCPATLILSYDINCVFSKYVEVNIHC